MVSSMTIRPSGCFSTGVYYVWLVSLIIVMPLQSPPTKTGHSGRAPNTQETYGNFAVPVYLCTITSSMCLSRMRKYLDGKDCQDADAIVQHFTYR